MKIELQELKNKAEITFWVSVPLRLNAALKDRSNLEAMHVLDGKIEEIAENGDAMAYWMGRGFGYLGLKVLDFDEPEVTSVLVDHLDESDNVAESSWLDENGKYSFYSGNPGTAATEAAMTIQEAMQYMLDGDVECAKTTLAIWLEMFGRGHIQYPKVREYVEEGERCEHVRRD